MATKKNLKLQASSIHRVWNCPGSLFLDNELSKEYKFNAFAGKASYGSMLHDIAEKKLLSPELSLPGLLKSYGLKRGSADYDKGMSTVKYYVKYIEKIKKESNCKNTRGALAFYIEEKFRLTVAGVECVAKVDALIIAEDGSNIYIDIFDLKTGHFNYEKSGKDQLIFSIMVIVASLFKDGKRKISYRWHIVQPNYWEDEKKVVTGGTTDMTSAMLMHILKKENEAIKDLGQGKIISGDHCTFCPAILTCPQVQNAVKVLENFRNRNLEDLQDITPEMLQYMFLNKSLIESYLKNIEGVIKEQMENGKDYPEIHTKMSSGKRTWKDEAKVKRKLKHLGNSIYEPPKLKSPAQLEKLAGKENLTEFTTQAKFKRLVPGAPENMFKDLVIEEVKKP